MSVVYLEGLLATKDLDSKQIPESWRAAMLRLQPNGDAPFTALTSKLKTKKIKQFVHHWFTKVMSAQRAPVTGVYTDTALSSAYTSGGVTNDQLYLKVTQANRLQFRADHVVLLRYAGDSTHAPDWAADTRAIVTGIGTHSSDGYVGIKLLEADDNSASHDLSDCNTVAIIGTTSGEGSALPTAINQLPEEMNNRMQIFKTPWSLSGSLQELELRTGAQLAEEQIEKAMMHGAELEKAQLMSILTTGTDSAGERRDTMMGLDPCIRQYAPGNVFDYVNDTTTAYKSKSWDEKGMDFFKSALETIFRNGKTRKTAFVGSGALLGIDRLASLAGHINLEPGQTDFGLKVMTWHTPFGDLDMLRHPWFCQEDSLRNRMLILDLGNITYVPLRDTDMKKIAEDGVDANRGYFITESTLEVALPQTMGIIDGVGLDNAQS